MPNSCIQMTTDIFPYIDITQKLAWLSVFHYSYFGPVNKVPSIHHRSFSLFVYYDHYIRDSYTSSLSRNVPQHCFTDFITIVNKDNRAKCAVIKSSKKTQGLTFSMTITLIYKKNLTAKPQ